MMIIHSKWYPTTKHAYRRTYIIHTPLLLPHKKHTHLFSTSTSTSHIRGKRNKLSQIPLRSNHKPTDESVINTSNKNYYDKANIITLVFTRHPIFTNATISCLTPCAQEYHYQHAYPFTTYTLATKAPVLTHYYYYYQLRHYSQYLYPNHTMCTTTNTHML